MLIIRILKEKFKILIILLFIIIISANNNSYCVDLKPSLHYGIKNIAKVNKLIPITVTIENRDLDSFKGKLLVNHYENNESIYQYEFDMEINENESYFKTFNVYITNRINTFYIQVINDKGETFLNERFNIDLSASDNKIIVGVITDNDDVLNLFNDIYIYDYTISTKAVQLTEEDYNENRYF